MPRFLMAANLAAGLAFTAMGLKAIWDYDQIRGFVILAVLLLGSMLVAFPMETDPSDCRRLTACGKSHHGIRPGLHPGGLRCSSVTYSRYAPSERLVRRAQPRSRCSRDFHLRLLIVESLEPAFFVVLLAQFHGQGSLLTSAP